MPSPLNHPEEIITENFLEWFTREKGFISVFDDKNTSGGDPVDCVGFIGNQLYLIEFKNTVSKSNIKFIKDKQAGIEDKIQRILKDLYGPCKGRAAKSAGDWFFGKEPIFLLVANSYSPTAVKELNQMLKERSGQWQFAYEVMEWKINKANIVLGNKPNKANLEDLAEISFPEMPYPKSIRQKSMKAEDLYPYSEKINAQETLQTLLIELDKLGAIQKLGSASNVNFSFLFNDGHLGRAVIAIYAKSFCLKHGIVVGISPPNLALIFPEQIFPTSNWPGKEGPKVGFLEYKRSLHSSADVLEFIQPLEFLKANRNNFSSSD